MLLPRFDFHEPATLQDCLSHLKQSGSDAAVLAGGTDLLVNMKKGLASPSVLVSLGRIDALQEISADRNSGSLRLGAMVTMGAIASHEAIAQGFGILVQAAQKLGSPLIRNRATIGGNLANGRPAGDTHGPLICLGAKITLEGESGTREVPVEDFFTGPGETVRKPDEILTQVVIESPSPRSGGAYLKYGIRKTLEISVVNVSVLLALGNGAKITHARVALGAVAPRTIRSENAERCLIGNRPDETIIQRAGEAAASDVHHPHIRRGSAEYRRILVAVLTRRAIREALRQASSGS